MVKEQKKASKKGTPKLIEPGGALLLEERKNMEGHAKDMLAATQESDSFLLFVATNKDGMIRYRYVTFKYPVQDMLKAPKALREHIYNDLENVKK